MVATGSKAPSFQGTPWAGVGQKCPARFFASVRVVLAFGLAHLDFAVQLFSLARGLAVNQSNRQQLVETIIYIVH